MSEQIVQVADASPSTKNMRTIQQTAGGNTVQSEVVILATGAANGGDTYDARQGMPPQSTTGSINATSQSVTRTLVGGKGVAISFTGTWNAGATGMLFYGSTDGSTFFAFSNVIDLTNYSLVVRITSSASSNHTFLLPTIAGLKAVQVTSLSWTSGAANITITESEGFATGFNVNNLNLAGFPTAAASADSTANPTLTQIEVFPMVWNGGTWDRISTAGNLGVTIIAANTIPVSQNLLGASDQPDVTVNHASRLPVNQNLLGATDQPDITVNQSGTLKTSNSNIPVLSTDSQNDLYVRQAPVQTVKGNWGPGWGNFTGW